jgi:hypothetical protein
VGALKAEFQIDRNPAVAIAAAQLREILEFLAQILGDAGALGIVADSVPVCCCGETVMVPWTLSGPPASLIARSRRRSRRLRHAPRCRT